MNEEKKAKLKKIYLDNSTPQELFEDTMEEIDSREQKIKNDVKELIEAVIPKVKDGEKGKDGIDGKTPTQEELLEMIKPLIPAAIPGKDGNLITPEEIRDKLNELKGIDRLSILSLKDLEWLKSKEGMNWASAGFKVYTDSSLTGDGSFGNPLKVIPSATSTKVAVDASDTNPDYLNPKITVSGGLTKTIVNSGGNEHINIDASGITPEDSDKVKASATDTTPAYLDTKLVAGTNVTLTKQNSGGNENIKIDVPTMTTPPASPSGSIQYNNGGVFGGSSNATLDANGKITISTPNGIDTGDVLSITAGLYNRQALSIGNNAQVNVLYNLNLGGSTLILNGAAGSSLNETNLTFDNTTIKDISGTLNFGTRGLGTTYATLNSTAFNLPYLTASKLVFTDASKNLTSTGIGTSGQFIKGDGSLDSSTYITRSGISAGTGISYNNTTGVITNSAPDQTVAFTGGANVTIGGTYPNFTITDNSINSSVTTLSSLTTIGTLTNLTVTNAPTFSALTLGSVPFAGTAGLLSQDNANFFYDSTNHRLALGTSTSISTLTLNGDLTFPTGADRTIAIQNATSGAGNKITIKTGAAFTNSAGAGGDFLITPGTGADSLSGSGGSAGRLVFTGANGGAGVAGLFITAGSGGGFIGTGGTGGALTGTNTVSSSPGGGGGFGFTGGTGGASSVAGVNGASGGSISFTSGTGGASTVATANNGSSGGFSFVSTNGIVSSLNNVAGGTGGISLTTGTGGTSQYNPGGGTGGASGGVTISTGLGGSGFYGTGGASGSFSFASNAGGAAGGVNVNLNLNVTGGNSGGFSLSSGAGGAAQLKTGFTGTIIAGNAGAFSLSSGVGGTATAGTNATGGNAAAFTFTQGASGAALSATGINTGGTSGNFQFLGAAGGAATGGTTAIGGSGSSMYFLPGAGGTASGASGSNTNGTTGSVFLNANAAGTFVGRTGIGMNTLPGAQLQVNTLTASGVNTILKNNATPGDFLQLQNSGGTVLTKIDSAGKYISGTPINTKGYTVATLPAGVQGDVAFVTDALLPTFLGIIAGGGAVVTPVFYNGTNWIAY